MKSLLTLCTLLLTAQLSYGQFFEDSLRIDKNKNIPVAIDGFATTFQVDPNIRNSRLVLGGIEELKEYKSRKLNFQLLGVDSVVEQNGHIRKVYQFKVAKITLGEVVLQDFTVDFEYVISRKNKKSKLISSRTPTIGMGYLRLFSNAQIAGNMLRLEDIKCEYHRDPAGCNPVSSTPPVVQSKPKPVIVQQPPNVVNPPAANVALTVRIVPCSLTTDVTQIKSQVRNLFAGANITIEEEMNVPPPAKALARVSDGITLRYFANDDKALAKNYATKLENQLSGFTVNEENMVPYFNNPIPSYFEVWIK
ncbi:MAG: hypothetical protein WBA74_12105 [Cyclobacteriaceae bacterium]